MLGIVGLMGLTGCSADTEPTEREWTTVQVMSYVSGLEDLERTRSTWTPPSGYVAYEGGDKSIGIAFTQNSEAPKMGTFFKSGSQWRTTVEDITAADYYLYGYIPYLTAIRFSVTDREGNNAKYNEGAKVKMENVPSVMPGDLCVVIGAKQGTDKVTVSGLRMGDFKYTASASETGNYVFLLFDHLYAALRVNMNVNGDYNKLRHIKLKSMQMKTQVGESITKQKMNITVDLRATDGSSSPINEISYEQTGADIETGIEFWSDTNGEQLTTTPKTFLGHFMPQDVTTLILTSVYDVYDTHDNLVRKDCMATNTILLSELLTDQTKTLRGRRYTVNMTVHPTYLYVLSEPDLDSPTITVN